MNATLLTGTTYFVETAEGTLSEPRKVEQDTEVKAVSLDEHWHLYETAEGQLLFVRPADDL